MSLQEYGTLLNLSAKLGSAAVALEKITGNQELSEDEREELSYIGDMVGVMDQKSPHYKSRKNNYNAVHATMMRARFFKKLVEMKFYPQTEFWEELYQTTKTGGREMHLTPEHAQKAYQLFQEISDNILSQLQHSRGHGRL